MTRFVFTTAVTLDGHLADPDHSLVWLFEVQGGGDLVGQFDDAGALDEARSRSPRSPSAPALPCSPGGSVPTVSTSSTSRTAASSRTSRTGSTVEIARTLSA